MLALKESALDNNIRCMARFAEAGGVELCPHVKTSMSPEIIRRQLESGACGVTVATVRQLQVCAALGAEFIVLANQIADPGSIRTLLKVQEEYGIKVYSLCDSEDLAVRLSEEATEMNCVLHLLLEVGVPGGRTGVRNRDDAMAVAGRVHKLPGLKLCGVECYEGVIDAGDPAETGRRIGVFLEDLLDTARLLIGEGFFAGDPVILSAGGSAHYDIVAPALAAGIPGVDTLPLLRCGCYVSHDNGWYHRFLERMEERSPEKNLPELLPALELWSVVQSVPEPGLAILNFGKRDAPYDIELPVPLKYCSEGEGVKKVPEGWRISALNDQHAFLRFSPNDAPDIGDPVCCGISHPCGAFDRWRKIPVVDEEYTVLDVYSTCF